MKTNQGAMNSRVKAVANICAESCRKIAAQIEEVKQRFVVDLRQTLDVPDRIFQLVLNEAVALAWQTGYPQLFFPGLATEKIQSAVEWSARQRQLRQKTSGHGVSN